MLVALLSLREDKINEVSRCPGHNRSLNTKDVARDDLCCHTCIVCVGGNLVCFVLLVLRLTELVLRLQVDPQLEAVG